MRTVAIRMPKMSMTMAEGEVLSWSVGPGDVINAGDVVCEVMTDKVDMEVESPTNGTLTEIVVDTGVVAVGEPIAWMETEDEEGLGDLLDAPAVVDAADTAALRPESVSDAQAAPTAKAPELAAVADAALPEPEPALITPTSAQPPAYTVPPPPVAAVPRARALARDRGVDLTQVTASRADGVVSVADVEAVTAPRSGTAEASSQPAPGALTAPSPATPLDPTSAPSPRATPSPAATPSAPITGTRVAAVRAVVARRMSESAAIPQFTVWRDLRLAGADARRGGVSWTTVLLQAYAAALRRVPALLTRWEDDGAVESGPPAIALAVDTPGGLLVPVFAEPDRQDPRELDAVVREAVRYAQTGKVARGHLLVANATLSNLGGLGVDRFQALVTPGQASVLALGKAGLRPVQVPGGIGVALSLTAGLTVDHRAANGADGARLLAGLADVLG